MNTGKMSDERTISVTPEEGKLLAAALELYFSAWANVVHPNHCACGFCDAMKEISDSDYCGQIQKLQSRLEGKGDE